MKMPWPDFACNPAIGADGAIGILAAGNSGAPVSAGLTNPIRGAFAMVKPALGNAEPQRSGAHGAGAPAGSYVRLTT
jgi:hypothetical protein